MSRGTLRDVEQLGAKIIQILPCQHFSLLTFRTAPDAPTAISLQKPALEKPRSWSCWYGRPRLDRQPAASACVVNRPQQAGCHDSKSCAPCCQDVAHQPNPRE